jgi:hypothetical protein
LLNVFVFLQTENTKREEEEEKVFKKKTIKNSKKSPLSNKYLNGIV